MRFDKDVPDIIQRAYEEKNSKWVASALFAMGRSADIRWKKHVLEKIPSQENEIKIEAIRSAGELEIEAARPLLLQMLKESIDGDDIRHTLIWALSKIGGGEIEEVFNNLLDNTDDEDEIEILEMAFHNLNFSKNKQSFDMF